MNHRQNSLAQLSLLLLAFAAANVLGGCSVSAKNDAPVSTETVKKADASSASTETKNSMRGARIKFAQNSPADTVRQFYKNLREKRFREAMMMTNLRPAVESLSAAEMEDLRADFETLAAQVPAEIEINGEIVSNNQATVTARMPDEETGAPGLKEFKLRRENADWVILTADEEAEKAVKKEGKNYFFSLRLDVHHAEVQSMMERVAKAQMVYAMQNGGAYADLKTLVASKLLPEDALSEASTGYRFDVQPSADKKKYWATAEPAVYGKTGKLSFLMEFSDKDNRTKLKSEDNKGAPLKGKKS